MPSTKPPVTPAILLTLLAMLLAMTAASPAAVAQGAGYWHTSGSQILDANGKRVRIGGVNWYGFETPDEVVHGLYAQDYHQILSTIHAQGYNTIRIPFSNQMVEHPVVPTAISTANASGPINSDLAGLNSLQILDKIVNAAGALGIKVILDNHRSEAGNSNESNGLWYTAAYPESQWIADWQTLVTRYKSFVDAKGNPIVIGVDLRNEPHLLASGARTGSCWTGDTWTNGCPTTNTAQNWPAAAERGAKAILSINQSLLIFVEGTDCYSGDCGWQGANLEGAKKYPVTLSVAGRLVYSAHDYGPDLSKQFWFSPDTTSATLDSVWTNYWAYLSIGNSAPVWLGEFGTTNASVDIENNAGGSQGQWFSALTAFLASQPNIQWTYWALNGEDTFGLLDPQYDSTPPSSLKQQALASIQFPLEGLGGQAPCAASPGAPAALTATGFGSASAQVQWSAVTAPANCSVTYSVFRSTTNGFAASAANQIASGLVSPSYTDTGLKATTTYYYRVEAVDAHGSSAASAQTSAKTAAAATVSCHVTYSVASQWNGGFQAAISIENTGTAAIAGWTLQWTFTKGEQITDVWGGNGSQSKTTVTVTSESYNADIAAGASVTGVGLTAVDSSTPGTPANFTVNGVACR